MSDTRYVVEVAKSDRSKCKKCKEKIAKGDIRIGVEVPKDDMVLKTWHHPPCFNLPRKYATGPDKITAEDFVCDILQDDSEDGTLLPYKADELAEAIASKPAKAASKTGDGADAEGATAIILGLKKAYEGREEGTEPASKKAKTDESVRVDAYGEYHKMTGTVLGDYLSWNKQVKSGKKDFVLLKVIDGATCGRLARCPLDGGRLKLTEDETVVCMGDFDKDSNVRLDCSYRTTAKEAPRWQPWFTERPTKEEEDAMERLVDEAKGEKVLVDASNDEDVAKLVAGASEFTWNLEKREGLRDATESVVQLFKDHPGKKVDIPSDVDEARQKVGPFLVDNKDKPTSEIISILVNEFGFVEDKEKKAAKKEAAMESVSKNPKNAPIAAALQELSSLFGKAGDRQRSGAYFRAAQVVNGVEYEITTENAMGLSKGKTKVVSIGKGSAEKILELLNTGTMQKLEEMRA